MRITFILPGYARKPSGGFRVIYEYANHLVARGHHVTVVHPENFSNWKPVLWRRRMYGRLRNFFRMTKVDWQTIDSRVRMLFIPDPSHYRIPDADAVFATAWQTAEQVLKYPDSKGDKYYFIQHHEVWNGPQERVDATWRAPMHKVVIAQWLYEKGLELGVRPENMTLIPNGINHDLFRLIEPFEQRGPKVAMLFSHADWKGGPDGVRALEIARQAYPALEAVFFGVSDRPVWIPVWIRYIKNPPQRVLVEEIYNKSGVYLCPSWAEGFHLPPAEAMACGCAVVGTDIGGIHDYAERDKTALLSSVKNPQALAENLLRVVKDDDLRVRLAKAGNERIKTFTWERSTDQFEQMLTQTASQPL